MNSLLEQRVETHQSLSRNTRAFLEPLIEKGTIRRHRIWGMLALRSALCGGQLLVVASVYGWAGRSAQPSFSAASAWWLWFATVTNIVCLWLLVRFGRTEEGLRLRELYFASSRTWKRDLLWLLGALPAIAALALVPSAVLADALWASPAQPNEMLLQPLPVPAIYPLFALFPATQALAELPVYWGYVAPRLRALGVNRWLVVAVVGSVLSLQHLFFSFQLDWRYDLWLAVKFLPFALFTGFLVDRRPTILPYLMAVHLLLDAAVPWLLLQAALGGTPG